MSQGVLDLIQAIDSGDSQTIDAAFNAEMATRISARIDTMRSEVTQNIFAEKVEEQVEEELELTQEELDEYMQTEEYEQLDELSKATLSSYVDKANQSIKDTKIAAGQAAHQAFKNEKRSPTQQIKHLKNRDSLNASAKKREANVSKAVDKLAK